MRFARHNPAFLGGRGVVVSLILIDHKLYRGITFFLPSIDDHPIICYSVFHADRSHLGNEAYFIQGVYTMITNIKYVANATTLKTLSAAISASESGSGKLVKAADLLYADGLRATMLGKDGDIGAMESVKAAIVAGFTKEEQALLASDIKLLAEELKPKRRETQMKIGPYVAKIKAHLAKFDKPLPTEEDTDTDTDTEATKKTKAGLQKVHEAIDRAIRELQKMEGAQGFDIAASIAKLNTAKVSIPLTKAPK